MASTVNVSGANKAIAGVQANVAGVWKTVTKIWINVGGVWKEAWPASSTTLVLTNISVVQTDEGPVTAGVRFNANGSIDAQGPTAGTFTPTHPGEWADNEPAATGALYEVRCVSISSGSWDTAAAATGTWVDLSVARAWSVTRTIMEGTGTDSCVAVFAVREIAVPANIVSATVTASAEII